MSVFLTAFLLAALTGAMFVIFGLSINMWAPLLLGFLSGILVGNVSLGLSIGATCALMALGFYTYGGATTPDYNVGAIFAVYYCATVAKGEAPTAELIQSGIVIGSIIALLMSWFDILGRAATTVFQHVGDRALARKSLKGFERAHLLGTIPWFLGRFIPVFFGMLFIDRADAIQNLVNNFAWAQHGLSVIGAALPAVGFALLLSYMDLKKYWMYMLLGYALFAYMGVPTIGLAIIGAVAAGLYIAGKKEKPAEEV